MWYHQFNHNHVQRWFNSGTINSSLLASTLAGTSFMTDILARVSTPESNPRKSVTFQILVTGQTIQVRCSHSNKISVQGQHLCSLLSELNLIICTQKEVELVTDFHYPVLEQEKRFVVLLKARTSPRTESCTILPHSFIYPCLH